MSVRPKIRNGNGKADNLTTNYLYCGYVMHQYKGIKSKMRWGQLWTEKNENDKGRCCIKLFKFDVINQKNELKKDLKQKLSFEFDEEDFCGLEKGEHYTRNGMRRYICIILRHEHLIVQDAVTARTDTDHNVIATWYKQISAAMHYIKSWKMRSGDRESKFLHASRTKLCVCYSLHNSSVGMKGKPLLISSWNVEDIQNAEEAETMFQNTIHTCVTFHNSRDVTGNKVSLSLEGAVKLKDFLPRTGKTKTTASDNMMGTLCPGFDDLNLNPNLVRITGRDAGVKKVKPAPMNLRELSDKQRVKCNNNYYDLEAEKNVAQANSGINRSLADAVQPLPENRNGRFAYENSYAERNEPFRPLNDLAPRPHRTYRPQPPRYDNHDQSKLKNHPDAVTQVSVDSDYQTGEVVTDNHSEMNSHHTLNLQHSSNATTNHDQQISSLRSQLVCDNSSSNSSDPPAIPKREELPNEREQVCDLVENALLQQQLSPIDTRPESFRPGYENSLSIEVSIAEILRDYDHDTRDIGLNLPYSVYISLVLGMEKESVANGSWKGLASALCLTLTDVEQIEAAVKNHPKLLQAEILLLHWSRTQAPYPFTRSNLRSILSEVMGRQDLANMIPPDEPSQQNSEDDSKKGDPKFMDPKK